MIIESGMEAGMQERMDLLEQVAISLALIPYEDCPGALRVVHAPLLAQRSQISPP